MPYYEYQRARDIYANQSEKGLVKRFSLLQGAVLTGILEGLTRLATGSRGEIQFNVNNITQANQIASTVQSRINSEGRGLFRWMLDRMTGIFGRNKDYANVFEPTESIDARIQREMLFAYGYDNSTRLIISNGYFQAVLNGNPLSSQVLQQINAAVAAKTPLKDFIKQFKAQFPKLSGNRQFDRFAHDFFQEFDRRVAWQYASDLGLDYGVYAGTAVDDSRVFCLQRLNRIYTLEKINDWNKLEWQGKRPCIDVKIACGGYFCRHQLNWISETFAQGLAEDRGQEINSYNKVAK